MNHSSDPMELFSQVFGASFATTKAEVSDGVEYCCNKCVKTLQYVAIADYNTELPRKLFYCTNKNCDWYGLLTVVAVKK